MNGSYYPNPTFPGATSPQQPQNYEPILPPLADGGTATNDGEMSYIENILRLNKGKRITAYVSFSDSNEWRDRQFKGIIEESGRDHLILSNPENGEWYLIPMIYVDYFTFDERINYSHAYSEKNF